MFAQDHPAQTPLEPDCLAEITSFEKANGPLSKRIVLRDGKPVSDSSGCRMANGYARCVRIQSVQALAGLISNLALNQACALGRGGGP